MTQGRVKVLDSSAFFSMDALPEGDHVCPPGVIKELEIHKDPRLALWTDMIRVSDCTDSSVRKVNEAADRTGDSGRLSPVDVTVVALALDVDGEVWSDDYSIQNVCSVLGIPFVPVGMKGITKVAKWNYQCIGCGKWFKEKMPECPICGSPMRGHRKKRSGEDALAPDQVAHPALAEETHAQVGGCLGPEREHIGQLLVGCRGLQGLLHDPAPLRLVISQRGG